jgi:hypothetical protein
MQLTRKQLKQIISEEIEYVSNEKDEVETLLEGYSASYSESDGLESEYVPKEAVIDFLEVLEENKIPLEAFKAFVANLPEETVLPMLKEVVEE